MAKKRIIAYFMHEAEEYAAVNMMKKVERTESYVMGEIDEVNIPALQKKGLIVQVLEREYEEAETPGKEWSKIAESRRPGRVRETLRRRGARRREIPVAPAKTDFYLIQLMGPLLEKWRKKFSTLDVKLLEYVHPNNYTARLKRRQVATIKALPFVSAVRLYGPEDTGPPILKFAGRPPGVAPPATGVKMLTYDIRLHREKDSRLVRTWLENHNIDIAGFSGRKIRLYLLENSLLASEIAALPEVAKIEKYVPPKLHNDIARILLGIDSPAGPNIETKIPQTGDGQTVAVADTGLDESHPDFRGRVEIVALGRPNDPSDPNGHGTHVAGSVLGDGSASNGKIRGTAPGAKLFFQSLLDSQEGLGGLPLNLGDLFEEAYKAGARIHNNSWGASTESMYTISSIEVDEFVATHRDMLIVFSAGNAGQAADRLNSQPGFTDWLSIDSPASSKNALTVGASRNRRTSGGYSQFTYGQAWPQDFPDPPVSTEKISGDPEKLAGFSSRGPCTDRRIKPDVVAPGTDIVSTKSSRAPLRNYWGPYPGNGRYAYMGGTSMAAPLISGCAAQVREYYIKNRNHEPSAALLKATLINSTRWLKGDDAVADHQLLPNYHQGFGCVYMSWAIPNPSEPNLKLEFIDSWKDQTRQFVRSGQRFRFQFSISPGSDWLRICLTWTDLPARALQNNLNLFVQYPHSGQKWIGNENLPMGLKIPDPDNNVEVVRLEKPQHGDYLIQVAATNLLQAPQDFALVVTGKLTSQLQIF